MPRKERLTHLHRWMNANGIDIETLAVELEESYGRIAHYVRRGAIPKPEMVKKLTRRTGLSAEAFLFPFEDLASAA